MNKFDYITKLPYWRLPLAIAQRRGVADLQRKFTYDLHGARAKNCARYAI